MSHEIYPATVKQGLIEQNNVIENLISNILKLSRDILAYSNETGLLGEAYSSHKNYMVDGHIVFLETFIRALEAKLAANQKHIREIDNHLSTSEWFHSGQIEIEIESYRFQINQLDILIDSMTKMGLSTGVTRLQNSRRSFVNLRDNRKEKLDRLSKYVYATRGIYDEPNRLMDEASRLLMRIEHTERIFTAGTMTLTMPSLAHVDEIRLKSESIAQEYRELLNHMRGTMIDEDLKWFEELYKMGHREFVVEHLKSYEALLLRLQRESRPNREYNLLGNITEHVKNRVLAEEYIRTHGGNRTFTEEEILLLGVILRYRPVERIDLNMDIKTTYFLEVSPHLDGASYLGIPDYLIPMWRYPTEQMKELFQKGTDIAPLAMATLFAFAGVGDIGKNMATTQGGWTSRYSFDQGNGLPQDVPNIVRQGAADGLQFESNSKSSQRLANQMQGRGWTQDSVRNTVNTPHTTRQSTNMATGNSATVYYNRDGSYVVVDNRTNAVLQVSDRFDQYWMPDKNIINPYIP